MAYDYDDLAAHHFPGCVEITCAEALAILQECDVKIEWEPAGPWGPAWTQPYIKHEGVWKRLGRTDLCDDVATGWCMVKTAEEWRALYIEQMSYGARYDTDRFSVIDQFSDG